MKYLAVLLIKFYRKFISPLFPAKCKYTPTCSGYALEAFRKFGFFRGFLLSVCRIFRCNPWSLGGFDPVPDKFTLRPKKIDYFAVRSEHNNYGHDDAEKDDNEEG